MKTKHHVFWTGGLDSTFRVINLLRTTEELVQPHYVIRHETSTGNEIDGMNNILRGVTRLYPDLRPKLLPTIYANEDLIPANEKVDAAAEAMRKKMRGVHEQYQILANYCKAYELEKVDVCYERLPGGVSPDTKGVSQYFGKTFPFDNFRNPHTQITKRECYDQAKAEGWAELLKLTSFCRRPRRKGRPCGSCGPCHDAVKVGLGFRLPFTSRMKVYLLMPLRNFYRRNYEKHNTSWFFKMIRCRFEHKF